MTGNHVVWVTTSPSKMCAEFNRLCEPGACQTPNSDTNYILGSYILMGSLKYEISQRCKELMQSETSVGGRQATAKSWRIYMDAAVKYGEWCKQIYKCRHFDNCKGHIQDYSDWLVEQGLSASTAHTYLAGVCRVFEVPLTDIQKPKHITSKNTRSRGLKDVDSRQDAKRETSPRLYDFASVIGCRRAEYARLCNDDLVTDESGYLSVRIRRGKGGKFQLQRILPEDELFVRTYFDGSESLVFTKAEMDNKIDLHHLRAVQAQRAYFYYAQRLRKEPEYRLQLETEIKARWRKYNKRRWQQREFEGFYKLRGANKQLAQRLGRPTEYDRLAVLATSVFHLSHWRCDVTTSNYLLAY